MTKQSYAAFDIDGTLIRWQLYHAFAERMASHHLLNNEQYSHVIDKKRHWQQRAASDSYETYERSVIDFVNSKITSLSYLTLQTICQEVVDEYHDQVYTFSRDLITQLKSQNYLLFAISTSPAELVSLVAAHYKFDAYAASVWEVHEDRLTGKEKLLLGPAKLKALKKLIKTHEAIQKGSLAIGDSEGDRYMLAHVEQPIAFNPSAELFDYATNKGWQIVIERKNVVYRLEYDHGRYLLQSTNSSTLIS